MLESLKAARKRDALGIALRVLAIQAVVAVLLIIWAARSGFPWTLIAGALLLIDLLLAAPLVASVLNWFFLVRALEDEDEDEDDDEYGFPRPGDERA